MSIDDMFASMGISPEEVVDDRKDHYLVDKRICLCGHSITKHKDVNDNKYRDDFGNGGWMCKPSAKVCLCNIPYPVKEVSDTRFFLRRTTGAGKLHALLKGMSTLATKGGTGRWLVTLTCAKCNESGDDKGISPVPLTKQGRESFDGMSVGYDTLLCNQCRKEV